MKEVFIINPHISRDKQYRLMQEIKKNFQGKRIIIEKTKKAGHAQLIARKYALMEEQPVHIFACGGDGILHEVVNGIAGYPHVQLSIIPIGTGNDFIKSIDGLTREDFLDLSNYKDPFTMKADLLKVNGEYVINTVSFGFDVSVADYSNQIKKRLPVKGIAPYYMGMLISLSKSFEQSYDIQLDEQHFPTCPYMFVVFCNGRFYGGGYQPCPQAKIDDGMIDVCLIKPVKKYQIVQLAKKYERGQHVQFSDLVSLHKVKVAHLDTDNQGILGNLDGEIRELKNPTIEIVEQAVHLVLPKKGE